MTSDRLAVVAVEQGVDDVELASRPSPPMRWRSLGLGDGVGHPLGVGERRRAPRCTCAGAIQPCGLHARATATS